MSTTATTRNMGVSVLHVRNFPDDLHHEANVEAALDRTSLRELVIEAVRRELDRRRHERQRRDARERRGPRP
jgi:hypothetical protein